jgi:hypothetical protein
MGIRIFIPMRLFHVYFVFQQAMKKHILEIELSKTPARGNSNRQNKANSSCFYNWTKSVLVIYNWTKSVQVIYIIPMCDTYMVQERRGGIVGDGDSLVT